MVAYHEVGHAIVGYAIGSETKVHKITMIPRGPAGGYTLFYQKKKNLSTLKNII